MIQTLSHFERNAPAASICISGLIIGMVPIARDLEHLLGAMKLSSASLALPGILLALLFLGSYYRAFFYQWNTRYSLLHGALLLLFSYFFYQHIGKNTVEYAHIPLYAGLYWSLTLSNEQQSPLIAIRSFMLCFLICCLDECFQYIAPDRVGDPRDITLNAAALLLGAFFVHPIYRKKGVLHERQS